MTQPLNFRRSKEPVQTIMPSLSEEDRIRNHLRVTNHPLVVEQMLVHWHTIQNTRRKLGIKDQS